MACSSAVSTWRTTTSSPRQLFCGSRRAGLTSPGCRALWTHIATQPDGLWPFPRSIGSNEQPLAGPSDCASGPKALVKAATGAKRAPAVVTAKLIFGDDGNIALGEYLVHRGVAEIVRPT